LLSAPPPSAEIHPLPVSTSASRRMPPPLPPPR